MKKISFIIVGIILFLFIIISYIVFSIKFGEHMHISSKIEIAIPLSAKLESNDSHGGFHGDGESLAKIYFTYEQAKKIELEINYNKHWRKLPMPERLQECVSVYTEEGMNMPIIENGYWFFLDRHSDADNRYDENEMYEEKRASRNYSVAVFDSNENILYYYEMDT